ncbi:MAG: type II toxin-antitoxin system HigB family toxin [Pleurocapsa sp. SU_196_0]|nr:type II toxin-antitoxin system HigB family toxin [Pleurocapsa sp. SU_196_0]
MREWYNALSKLQPRNFAELKTEFSSVDLVHLRGGEGVYVFDVGGNKYRIIVKLDFEFRVGFILYAFTHHEYTKWNKGGRP